MAPGARDDSLDVFGQLGFRPDHPIDSQFSAKRVAIAERLQQVIARHDADRRSGAQAPGDQRRQDVDFVRSSRGDQVVAVSGAGLPQRVRAGAVAGEEADIEIGEPIGNRRLLIHDDDFVCRRQSAADAETDLPATDYENSPALHSPGILSCPAIFANRSKVRSPMRMTSRAATRFLEYVGGRGIALITLAVVISAGVFIFVGGGPLVVAFSASSVAIFWAMHLRLALGRWPALAYLAIAGLIAIARPETRMLVAPLLTAGIIAAELVDAVQSRSSLLWAGVKVGVWCAVIGVAVALGTAGFDLGPLTPVEALLLGAVGPASAAATLVFGAPLEWLFGHVTRLTLSEWLSYDHPLIRRLSLSAPGTFQHSANVALLADAAARSIGADALMSRVGGLYHDVGKANTPEYFIENQHGTNPHDALSADESAAIFKAHVTDGVAMVLEHAMGERIAAFVREHHGTGVMRSLLNKPSFVGRPCRRAGARLSRPQAPLA